MLRNEFEQAKKSYNYEDIFEPLHKELFKKRDNFVKTFNIDKIRTLSLEEYVQGKGNRNSFCYHIERTFNNLGCILGSTSYKFGIFYSEKDKEYKYYPKWGKSTDEAFKRIKEEIIQLLKDGEQENLQGIVNNPLATTIKGKLLALYFPKRYLNIFSKEHLNYYLKFYGLDNKDLINSDPVYKRDKLIQFKNEDTTMRNWSIEKFATFLYSTYPKAPTKENKSEEQDFSTYTLEDVKFINLTYNQIQTNHNKNNSKKKNYEEEQRRKTILGNRGEKIVFDYETKLGHNPKHIAIESDAEGYDILSHDKEDNEIYIEVKATSTKIGKFSFYYTEHEHQTALKYGDKYHIYIVFDVKGSSPQIWDMGNPFIHSNHRLELLPVLYKIELNTKKL